MLRYAITEGLPPGEAAARATAARWAAAGVSYVQLRAKFIDAGELSRRARALLTALHGTGLRLLVNGRADVAMAAGAGGVHLTAAPDELTPAQVRQLIPGAIVSASCHTLAQVARARDAGADLILFGPVFEKRVDGARVAAGTGLDALRKAVQTAAAVPVLALGGVTEENAPECCRAGAAGLAAIRIFR